MNWLTNFVKPTLKKIVNYNEVPDDLWVKCNNCAQSIFHRDLKNNHHICTQCGYHFRISPTERLSQIFDDGEYNIFELPKVKEDPLKFKDQKKYTERLKIARQKTKSYDALTVASGKINNQQTVVAVFNFNFMGGSMGSYVGEAFIAASMLAITQKTPFVVITASGGARMQEGMISLMQMARTTVAVEKIKEEKLPYIVVLTDPTTGGVSASFAMIGDIAIAEKGATIAFAGRRVVEQTIGEKLPDDAQTSEFLFKKGMVDIVVDRTELKDTLGKIINVLMTKNNNTEEK